MKSLRGGNQINFTSKERQIFQNKITWIKFVAIRDIDYGMSNIQFVIPKAEAVSLYFLN